jgi:mannose-6-phosphate isomerase-like protein (cupin superfamily)
VDLRRKKKLVRPGAASIHAVEVVDTLNNTVPVYRRADSDGHQLFDQLLDQYSSSERGEVPRYIVRAYNDAGEIVVDNKGRSGQALRYFDRNPGRRTMAKTSKKLKWVTQGGERSARGPRGSYRITKPDARSSYKVELIKYGKTVEYHFGSLDSVKAWAGGHAFPHPDVQSILDSIPEEISTQQLIHLQNEEAWIEAEIIDPDNRVVDWDHRLDLVKQKIQAMLDVASDMGASHYAMGVDQGAIDDYNENLLDTAYELWGRGSLFNAASRGFDAAQEFDEVGEVQSENPAKVSKLKSRLLR